MNRLPTLDRQFYTIHVVAAPSYCSHNSSSTRINLHLPPARPHKTLTTRNLAKPTSAMAEGVADHVWSIEEIVALIEARERAESN